MAFSDGSVYLNWGWSWDGDGIKNSGDTGYYGGVTVHLLNTNGHELASTTTNMYGGYFFSNVAVGDYKLKFDLPTGDPHNWYVFSPAGQGSDPTADSDVNGSGYTATFTVTSGSYVSRDAGIIYITDNAP
jgi:SdrD B-like domain